MTDYLLLPEQRCCAVPVKCYPWLTTANLNQPGMSRKRETTIIFTCIRSFPNG
jgi:hypothetical protein